ncbi:MAG TPA: hypothetical protein VF132_03265 [Rudaea sp.]
MFRDKRMSFTVLVFGLIGHLLGTGAIFIAFLLIAWLISFLLASIELVHPFPPDISDIFAHIEVWLIYADFIVCAIVFIAGAWRFCAEMAQPRRR